MLAALALAAAFAVPPGNLLTNPGAEAAAGAADSATILPPPGWQATGEFTAVQYGAPDFLTADDGTRLGGGANFFAGGNTAQSGGTQSVDVSGAAAEIDAGGVFATLSALLGGFASQDDNVSVTMSFADASSAPVGATVVLPSVSAQDRNSVTTLLPRSDTEPVPAGTRTIVVNITANRVEGSYNDGYADNVSLSLSTAPPPVFHKTFVAGVESGTIRFRKPGAKAFVKLGADQALPLGSLIDAKHGVMELTSVPTGGGTPQSAKFYSGQFKVTQPGSVTQLALSEPLARCGAHASAAAKKKKPKTRRLWGSGSGSFRTSGKYSAATVRGTKWLVQDSCSGTLTKVTQGTVVVLDKVKRKNVVVRAGHKYLAKPKR